MRHRGRGGHRDGHQRLGALDAVGGGDGEGVGGGLGGGLALPVGGGVGERPGDRVDADGTAAGGGGRCAVSQGPSGGVGERCGAIDPAGQQGRSGGSERVSDRGAGVDRNGDRSGRVVHPVVGGDGEGIGGGSGRGLALTQGGGVGIGAGDGVDGDRRAAGRGDRGAVGQGPTGRVGEARRSGDHTGVQVQVALDENAGLRGTRAHRHRDRLRSAVEPVGRGHREGVGGPSHRCLPLGLGRGIGIGTRNRVDTDRATTRGGHRSAEGQGPPNRIGYNATTSHRTGDCVGSGRVDDDMRRDRSDRGARIDRHSDQLRNVVDTIGGRDSERVSGGGRGRLALRQGRRVTERPGNFVHANRAAAGRRARSAVGQGQTLPGAVGEHRRSRDRAHQVVGAAQRDTPGHRDTRTHRHRDRLSHRPHPVESGHRERVRRRRGRRTALRHGGGVEERPSGRIDADRGTGLTGGRAAKGQRAPGGIGEHRGAPQRTGGGVCGVLGGHPGHRGTRIDSDRHRLDPVVDPIVRRHRERVRRGGRRRLPLGELRGVDERPRRGIDTHRAPTGRGPRHAVGQRPPDRIGEQRRPAHHTRGRDRRILGHGARLRGTRPHRHRHQLRSAVDPVGRRHRERIRRRPRRRLPLRQRRGIGVSPRRGIDRHRAPTSRGSRHRSAIGQRPTRRVRKHRPPGHHTSHAIGRPRRRRLGHRLTRIDGHRHQLIRAGGPIGRRHRERIRRRVGRRSTLIHRRGVHIRPRGPVDTDRAPTSRSRRRGVGQHLATRIGERHRPADLTRRRRRHPRSEAPRHRRQHRRRHRRRRRPLNRAHPTCRHHNRTRNRARTRPHPPELTKCGSREYPRQRRLHRGERPAATQRRENPRQPRPRRRGSRRDHRHIRRQSPELPPTRERPRTHRRRSPQHTRTRRGRRRRSRHHRSGTRRRRPTSIRPEPPRHSTVDLRIR